MLNLLIWTLIVEAAQIDPGIDSFARFPDQCESNYVCILLTLKIKDIQTKAIQLGYYDGYWVGGGQEALQMREELIRTEQLLQCWGLCWKLKAPNISLKHRYYWSEELKTVIGAKAWAVGQMPLE